ncbi:FkbM family methyltransferase [Chloroflexota bacterium]
MSKSDLPKIFFAKMVRLGYATGILRIAIVQSAASYFYTKLVFPILCRLFPSYSQQIISVDDLLFNVSTADQGGIGFTISLKQNAYMTRLFRDIAKPGTCILDCGAYIGYYTVQGSKLVGEYGKVIAIEPHPANFKLLQQNVATNNCHNVIMHQVALSDTADITPFFINKRDSTAHSLHPRDSRNSSGSLSVETMRGDDICKGEVVNLIKIDVEGAELAVLKGMENILAQEQLALFIEFQPKNLLRAGVEPAMLIAFLKERNFTLFHIDEKQNVLHHLESKDAINDLQESKKEQNLLCIKGITLAETQESVLT